jgi:hypothetical protein
MNKAQINWWGRTLAVVFGTVFFVSVSFIFATFTSLDFWHVLIMATLVEVLFVGQKTRLEEKENDNRRKEESNPSGTE